MKYIPLFLLIVSLSAHAGVIVDEKEWRQVSETAGFTWAEVASVCDPTTGGCSSSLGGIEFNGWTWASVEDLNGLFNSYIPGSSNNIGPGPDEFKEANSVAIPLFFDDFNQTSSIVGFVQQVVGLTRTTTNYASGLAYEGSATNFFNFNPQYNDSFKTFGVFGKETEAAGFWLYKTVNPVPEPPIFLLFVISLIALCGSQRARSLDAITHRKNE